MSKLNYLFFGLIVLFFQQCQQTDNMFEDKINDINFRTYETNKDFFNENSPMVLNLTIDCLKPESAITDWERKNDDNPSYAHMLDEDDVENLVSMIDTSIIQNTEENNARHDIFVEEDIKQGGLTSYGALVNDFGVGFRIKKDSVTNKYVFNYYMQFPAFRQSPKETRIPLSGIKDVKKFHAILVKTKKAMENYD